MKFKITRTEIYRSANITETDEIDTRDIKLTFKEGESQHNQDDVMRAIQRGLDSGELDFDFCNDVGHREKFDELKDEIEIIEDDEDEYDEYEEDEYEEDDEEGDEEGGEEDDEEDDEDEEEPTTNIPPVEIKIDTRSVNGIDFNMVWCPAGEFWMGSEEGVGGDRERPRHRVKISQPFLMGQTQVTQALWEAVMGSNPSKFKGAARPVEQVSWFDCVRFCNKLSEMEGLAAAYQIGSGDKPEVTLNMQAAGYRLPTEAEWEYAAKAGTELKYAGSNKRDTVAWYDGNCSETHPVGEKQANAWGLYDMSGNVWEWCSDQWDENAYKSRNGTVTDPLVYAAGPSPRVSRGGSWGDFADCCRVASRRWNGADYRWCGLGVRLLRWNLDT